MTILAAIAATTITLTAASALLKRADDKRCAWANQTGDDDA